MPLYEYQCKTCGKKIEIIQDVDHEAPECCPVCKGELKRLLGVPALIFKGTGFYATDYAKKGTIGRPGKQTSDQEPADSQKAGKSDGDDKDSSMKADKSVAGDADKPVA
ncbi:zinc ribbon domain-containing protein [bacterium]|nr:zinc ribbon domain-containing protein [bacterium]